MMTEERVKTYKVQLENGLQDIHERRMVFLRMRAYEAMAICDDEFWKKVAQIKTVDYILDH